MVTVAVDGDGEGALVATSLGVELLGLGLVVGAQIATVALLVTLDDRGGSAVGGLTGAGEDLLGDGLAVDVHRQGLDEV